MDTLEQAPHTDFTQDLILIPVSEQAIRERAYELYEKRGRQDGLAEEDWIHAEAQLRSEMFARQDSYTAT